MLTDTFLDMVGSPASNSFLKEDQLSEPEVYYPLRIYTCGNCFLVQVDEYKKSESIFDNEYVYFSSYSKSWLSHAKQYTEKVVNRFGFSKESFVVEIASNDGYLLQYFKELNIPVLGIEPTANTAEIAAAKGIESVVEFFGTGLASRLANEGRMADLIVGNNVLAHVPDIVDFVSGMKIILKPSGVITMEFPHLARLVQYNQFDTIYHEHFSYLSFFTVNKIFGAAGLKIFDVEELSTHGGSLRIYAAHEEDMSKEISANVEILLEGEISIGINTLKYYNNFQQRVLQAKLRFINFLVKEKLAGKKIAAYGAAAKGNTLLNYCGIKNDIIDFVVDANPHKQNKWLPGSHIPVVDETVLRESKPDYVIIFPWNIKEEIIKQLDYIKEWGGCFVIPIPQLQILEYKHEVTQNLIEEDVILV